MSWSRLPFADRYRLRSPVLSKRALSPLVSQLREDARRQATSEPLGALPTSAFAWLVPPRSWTTHADTHRDLRINQSLPPLQPRREPNVKPASRWTRRLVALSKPKRSHSISGRPEPFVYARNKGSTAWTGDEPDLVEQYCPCQGVSSWQLFTEIEDRQATQLAVTVLGG